MENELFNELLRELRRTDVSFSRLESELGTIRSKLEKIDSFMLDSARDRSKLREDLNKLGGQEGTEKRSFDSAIAKIFWAAVGAGAINYQKVLEAFRMK